MPPSTTATPPAAPKPQGVTIVDLPPPPPPPAPTSTIHVSGMPQSPDPAPAPSKGSAMDRLRQDLAKRAKPADSPPIHGDAGHTDASTGTKPAPTSKVDPSKTAPPEPTPDPGSPSPDPGSTPPADPAAAAKAQKANPWKLVDQYKGRIGELEKQIAEAKTGALAEQAKKQYLDQIEKLSKTNEELANEIRYVNYSKHPEFIEKYQKPYEAAWKRAVSELGEINLRDPETQIQRAATAQDLLALVNLPLGKAREVANQVFGDFADDVMAHRKELRTLFDAQAEALEKARTSGAEREKQQAEIQQKQRGETSQHISSVWEAENKAVTADPEYGHYVTPEEGDDEGNARLERGFSLVQKGFSENPEQPGITPEERELRVKRHVAIWHRAAAFGKMRHLVEKLQAEKAALAKELEEYRGSTPSTEGATAPQSTTAIPTAKESVFSALRKLAK